MRRLVAAAATTLIAGAAATTLGAGPAQAGTAAATGTPIMLGQLHLTRTDVSGVTAEADLTCVKGVNVYGRVYVAGNGTVTDPTAACRELDAVGGDLSQMLVHPTWLISELYAPVSVTATGWWGDDQVGYCDTYVNNGDLTRTMGDVFAF